MDALIAILGVIAGIQAVIGGGLPLYTTYREERKKLNQLGQTEPATRSEPEG